MTPLVYVGAAVFAVVWILLLYTIFINPPQAKEIISETAILKTTAVSNTINSLNSLRHSAATFSRKEHVHTPLPYKETLKLLPPPSLDEIKQNMTLYLTTLHTQLNNIAGPKITAQTVWNTFLNVTTSMPMYWNDIHKNAYHIPRKDNSIFVGVVTYRDPYCPMTMKSLFSQAKHPDKLNIILFQQNCFDKICRTGVLKGGIVEDTSSDIDCYIDFCQSKEGIHSNACNTGQIRLFNVNESESLGPYMARYLAVKFYQGEQYYLQIDSHSGIVCMSLCYLV